MKTKLGLICLLLMSIKVSEAQKNEHKIKFGFSVQPHYYSTIGIHHEIHALGDNAIKAIDRKPSLSANIFFNKKITKRKNLMMGLGYQYGARKRNKTSFSKRLIAPDSTYSQFELSSYHHNIEIPININYSINKKIFLSYGLSGIINLANINHWKLYKKDGTMENKFQKMEDNDTFTKYKKGNLALNFGFGLNLLNTDKMIFSVKPTLQVSLLNQIDHYALGYQKSVFTGINFIILFK